MKMIDGQNGQAYVTIPTGTQVDFEGKLEYWMMVITCHLQKD